MAQKYSFRDPVTGELKAWGFVETNQGGDIRQAEADNFTLDLLHGRWRWDGVQWVPFIQPPPPPTSLATLLDAAIAAMPPIDPRIKAVFVEWRKQVS